MYGGDDFEREVSQHLRFVVRERAAQPVICNLQIFNLQSHPLLALARALQVLDYIAMVDAVCKTADAETLQRMEDAFMMCCRLEHVSLVGFHCH
jgi:hypothetical protein